MSMWWYLGEAFNWCHVIFMSSCLLMGFFWMRPVWLWLVLWLGTFISWQIFGGCPFTMLGDWLQSRHGDSFHMSFVEIYGPMLGCIIVFALMIAGGLLGVWLAKRARGPLIWPGLDEKFRQDIGLD